MNKSWLEKTLRVRLPITLAVALITYAITFFISEDERFNVGYQPEQPIPFSHKKHSGEMKIDCRYCHTGVEKGRHAVIPALNVCMNCHNEVKTESPHIKKLTKAYEENTPWPWKRVYRMPDHVFFDHSVHIAKGFDCFQCHGEVNTMDTVKQIQKMTMGMCINCHQGEHKEQAGLEGEIKGPTNCSACHR